MGRDPPRGAGRRARRRGRRARAAARGRTDGRARARRSGCCTQGREHSLDQHLATRRSRSSCRRAPRTSARASPRSARSAPPRFEGTMNVAAGDARDAPERRATTPSTRCGRGSRRTCRARGIDAAAPVAPPRSGRCARARVRGVVPDVRGVGLAVPTWPVAYGGLDLAPGQARAAEAELRRSTSAGSTRSGSTARRPRCSRTAPRSSGCASCRRSCATRRSGASCSASRARARTSRRSRPGPTRDGDEWVRHRAEGLDHVGAPLRLRDLPRPHRSRRAEAPRAHVLPRRPAPARASTVRPLRHIGGEVDFNEVFLDDVRVPDAHRVGAIGDGWRVAGATLAGERQMVSGSGSGGVDRIGGSGIDRVIERARELGRTGDAVVRQQLMRLYSEERIRGLDEPARARAGARPGGTPGPAGSIGKVHQGALNQRAPAARGRPARRRTRSRGTAERAISRRGPTACRSRSRACCAAGPTRSRAAPPR